MTVVDSGRPAVRGTPAGRNGFTLLEVIVAMTIGGIAVLASASLLIAVADRAESIERVAARADREANAERLLDSLVGNLDVAANRSPALEGDAREVRFQSWCESPAGFLQLCAVHLFFNVAAGGSMLIVELTVASTAPGDPAKNARRIELRHEFETGALLYLLHASRGGTWTDAWSSSTLPAALAVVLDADTLILRVP